jgi:iron complex outermembrane receptor protein
MNSEWRVGRLIVTGFAASAMAEAAAQDYLPSVLITGKRASLMSAQDLKRDKTEIVDSVLAEDIDKLPDLSVTDALQRVTGVQIARDRGEGGVVAIRGLTQMETMLNGREVFTAGSGRNLDFADIPAELVAGIDVYKTSSAAHLEGGVGGAIDVRTRRPFDFKGRMLAASARLIHGDLINKAKPQVYVLASERWAIPGSGEVGLLLNLSHQRRGWREDQKGTGNPLLRKDLIPGTDVVAPNGTSETTSVGQRERDAAGLVLQWRPASHIELTAEANAARFFTLQDSHQINVTASPTFVAGSPTLFAGTGDLKSITWTNAPLSILSFARDTLDRNRQFALNGRWRGEALTVSADLSQTTSFNSLFFSGPFFAASTATFSHDLSTPVPTTSIAGTDLLDPANVRYTGVAYRARPFDGKLKAARIDADYKLAGGFIETVSGGLRLARRQAGNAPGLVFADATLTGMTAASRPGEVMPNPFSDYFSGEAGGSIRNYLIGNLATARNAAALRSEFGISAPIPAGGAPIGLWDIQEETSSAYLQASFKGAGVPVDGNAGLRLVRTREKVTGSQTVPATGAVAPIRIDSSYSDVLPSLNLRYRLAHEGLFLRGAASKTITRPNFDQLSPSLTLVRNPVNPSLNQGGAGNPALEPVRSDNLDLALEQYFQRKGSVYLTAFLKKTDGFVLNASAPEVHAGETYQVTRPRNAARAHIKGAEAGYQQFYDFLPGWLGGLGLQANYTFVDSRMPNAATGGNLPLQNLSRHSANVVGIYEKGPVSARLAWNWRDKFHSGTTTVVGVGALPVYTKAYGWLDASLGYHLNRHVSLALEATNLLRTRRTAYYGVETRPQSVWMNDRQVSLTVTIRQ